MPTPSPVCQVCGSETMERLFKAKDKNRRIDEREFDVLRCATCGVGFTLPQLSPVELITYYPEEYYSLDTSLELERALRPHNQSRVRRIKRFVAGGRLLDIGAGTGMFLKAAKENGFDVEGLELSEDAVAFGNTTWGLPIRHGSLHETTLPAQHYDVVTLGHVYEHLREPQWVATHVAGLLKRHGLLVISVPNFASVQSKVFRAEWFHLDVPRHLFHYTPSGMKKLIEAAGLTPVDLNFHSGEHNWAGILGSVMQLSRPGELIMHKVFRKAVGTPVAKALAFAEAALGKGGTFEMYARKQ